MIVKRLTQNILIHIIITLALVFSASLCLADDTCVFAVTADDVPPNIVILLDNGAEMEQIIWHRLYVNSTDYTTPLRNGVDDDGNGTIDDNGLAELKFEDVVLSNNAATATGFFWDNGYSVIRSGNKYFIVPIKDDLTPGGMGVFIEAPVNAPRFTINGKTVTLPYDPSSVAINGVIDNAEIFRYSKNYLNWIFFGPYGGDGSDLPRISRFYYAKQAIFSVAKLTANQAQFGVNNFTANADGSSNVQPLGMAVNTPLAADPANNTLDPNFVNTINNMGTVNYSPLAEGLASLGGYYASPASGVVDEYCQKNFALVVTPGMSSEDQAVAAGSSPTLLSDDDGDNAATGIGEGNIKADANTYAIPVNINGSTYLDDVAHWLFNNDVVGYRDGVQVVQTYTVGFMGDAVGNLFLINTSNNGNGFQNLYDTSHEEYGKYHFTAQDPNDLAAQMMAAVTDIISKTSAFTAPVVPVTRTTSGNRVYMAFFKPSDENFWEGNVTKFGLSADNEIIDAQGNAATFPNGAIKEDAVPYWATIDWADPNAGNHMDNQTGQANSRKIYTYLGMNTELTHASNAFTSGNAGLTAAVLGAPTRTTAQIIDYVRGADVLDEDNDGDLTENRALITGDVLHSEPMVFQYNYPDGSLKKIVYFGSNGGMLHAVLDETVDAGGTQTSYGTEAWAFIPPNQLHRLKDMVEGASHQFYIDSTPKVYFMDVNKNGILDADDNDRVILVCGERKGGTSYFALDVTSPFAPKYLWRINQYYDHISGTVRLTNVNGSWQDMTFGDHFPSNDPNIGGFDKFICVDGTLAANVVRYDCFFGSLLNVGDTIFGYRSGFGYTDNVYGTVAAISLDAPITTPPTTVIAELGETWSEPKFGRVKTSDGDTTGTLVMFVGGGYSPDNLKGNAVLAINLLTGTLVKKFATGWSTPGMSYSVPSSVTVIDENSNGFIDKVYVGDLGGQMWRFGKYTDDAGNALTFPKSNENINAWTGQVLFLTDTAHSRKFYYPPTVTLEIGYDLVFFGTGDRENACCQNDTVACDSPAPNYIGTVKDNHSSEMIIGEKEDAGVYTTYALVDLTDPASTPPDLGNDTGDVDNNTIYDKGWYIRLVDASGDAVGEKALAESQVFFGVFYFTTFTPNDDPCLPGGESKLYALQYLSGAAVLPLGSDGDLDRSMVIGGGIASKPVLVLTEDSAKLLISVGSTNPDETSEETGAGILAEDPLAPELNFFYQWWRDW